MAKASWLPSFRRPSPVSPGPVAEDWNTYIEQMLNYIVWPTMTQKGRKGKGGEAQEQRARNKKTKSYAYKLPAIWTRTNCWSALGPEWGKSI